MNDRICEVIAKLKADANELEFTGFITNAHVTCPSILEGEIWHHVRAESCGRFADGHRIQTSRIVDINAHGESLWVDTENGSRYGILSFAPLGWIYFSNLHRAFDQLDPVPAGAPIFDLHSLRHGRRPAEHGGLAKIIERRLRRERTKSESSIRSSNPLRPDPNPDYLKQMKEHARESIAMLQRNGVNITKHDE